jgi:phosphoribosylformylglycinamidine synthase PurS subunit
VYKANICITLRSSILDPQGKASESALSSLGFDTIDHVRIGKYAELWIEAEDADAARVIAQQACEKLLANPVMEDFAVSLESV